MMSAFFYGVILAFGLIIPLGTQNLFVFNQGASQRRLWHALPSVLTASLCDSILIMMAILGISVAVLSIVWLKTIIFIVGFVFLLYMGWVTWNSQPASLNGEENPLSAKKQAGFAISVSLLNPHALLDTISVIGTNSLNFVGSARWIYALACILVSWCWFFGLAITGRVVNKVDKSGRFLYMINKFSALIIWSVASYIGYQLIRGG